MIDTVGLNGGAGVACLCRTTSICINGHVFVLRALWPLGNVDVTCLSWVWPFFASRAVVNAVVINLKSKESENQRYLNGIRNPLTATTCSFFVGVFN